ncbi:hypothetical protein [Clostridium aminobutyricum]|uniref:Uncharacterized protein n=1 Tax=Clostridium aminobutyricum TaxID=33953 RepID=A0A939D7Y0_CLOAM|nr:hypothetical protein [Clostridium aminobutyricum]MBN7773154.1 hypothetical protein [Clostridium aminobutyricum]
MKIKLNDNTELNVIQVNGSSRYFQGSNRDSLEFVFAKDAYTFTELEALFAERTKTAKVTTLDDTDTENPVELGAFDDYTLRASMELKPVIVTPATTEIPEVTEERIFVVMAQLTYIEKQLNKLGVL